MPLARSTSASPAAQRSPAWFVAGLAVGALVVAGLALWRTRTNSPKTPVLKYLPYSGHDYSPAASPDGKTIAFTSDRDGRPRIWLKEFAGGAEKALSAGPDDYARFSPDAATILFSLTQPSLTHLHQIPLPPAPPPQ